MITQGFEKTTKCVVQMLTMPNKYLVTSGVLLVHAMIGSTVQ